MSVVANSLDDTFLSEDYVTKDYVENSISAALSNYTPGGGGGSGGFGTITLVNNYSSNWESLLGVSVNGINYTLIPNVAGGVPDIGGQYTIIVPENSIISILGTIDSGYFSAEKNGINISRERTYTINANDAYCFSYFECLSPSTLIALASGDEVALSDLNVGNEIMAIDPETNELVSDEVIEVSSGEGKFYDVWKFSDGTEVTTVGRHRFYNVNLGEMMYLEAWNLGERAVHLIGSQPYLLSHERFYKQHPHMTLFTKTWNNYFANGLLAGNRYSTKLTIK